MKCSAVSSACWMSFRSCDAQITHSPAHQKRASKEWGLISLSCTYEWTISAGLPPRLFVLRNQIHLRQIRGAPLVPSLWPGILPLGLQSLHSSAGLSKARSCRRLQWAAVMGLKLCALIRPVCQRWIPAVTQPHPNPASHLSLFPSLSLISQKHVCCLWFRPVSVEDQLPNGEGIKNILVVFETAFLKKDILR